MEVSLFFKLLKEEGLTDLSAEEFKAEYAAGTAKNTELYSYLKSEKLTDLDAEKFNIEYFPGVEKKNPNNKKNKGSQNTRYTSDMLLTSRGPNWSNHIC